MGCIMGMEFLTLASFVIVSTFTPGPANIAGASMGIIYGYKKALRYITGLIIGFFFWMIICAYMSSVLLIIMPSFEKIFRIAGACYILWLAFTLLKSDYAFKSSKESYEGAFKKAILLQLVNPKLIIFGLTIYSTFLVSIKHNPVMLAVSAIILSCVGFCAVSTWTIFGAVIKKHLNNKILKRIINLSLSALLVYTAIEISGLI